VVVLGERVCPAGCAANDQAPYFEYCHECQRDYETGLRHSHLCHECYEILMLAMRASYRTVDETPDYRRKEHQRRLAESER